MKHVYASVALLVLLSASFALARQGGYDSPPQSSPYAAQSASGIQPLASNLSIGSISGSPFCPGATLSVSFSNATAASAGNVYTVQLSDASGSFASPVTIGSLAGTAGSGSISATIPADAGYGTGYRIRVASSNPADMSADNGTDLRINGRLYVDGAASSWGNGSSWASPLKTIDSALRIANANTCTQEIWVKAGTYYPMAGGALATSRDSSLRIMRNGIRLYGGFAGTESSLSQRNVTADLTTLSGDIGTANDSSDNCYHVMTITSTSSNHIDTTTVVDGFTISFGQNDGGGGIWINGLASYRSDGGGILINGFGAGNECSPLIEHCTLSRNSGIYGAGIYNYSASSGRACPVIRNCSFTGNVSTQTGGALRNYGANSSPFVSYCDFSANRAASGSAVHNDGSVGTASPTFDQCSFTGNIGTNNGAIRANGASDTIWLTNCSFSNNASSWGGSIDIELGSHGIVSNCSFSNNTARTVGAGIFVNAATINVSDCSFSGNQAADTSSSGWGGAIGIIGPSSQMPQVIRNTSFSNNYAKLVGGAIYAQDTNSLVMDSISSSHNWSNGGGFIYFHPPASRSCKVTNSVFNADSCTGYGGIFNIGGGAYDFENCQFLNSYGEITGAFDQSAYGGHVFRNCVFSGNKSLYYGAAVHAYQAYDTFYNCVFTHNSVLGGGGAGGGAIHTNGNSVIAAYNCTFSENSSPGNTGYYTGVNTFSWDGSPAVSLVNCIVWQSEKGTMGGSTSGSRSYINSLIKNVAIPAPNLTVYPNFVNDADPIGADGLWGTADDGLRLTQCSPAINAGADSLVPASISADFAGTTRIQQSAVDMGAYESSFGGTDFNPSVAIAVSPTPAQCGGGTFNFLAQLLSPGGTSSYQWYRGGTAVGGNSPSYSGSFSSTDSISVKVTNSWCPDYSIGDAKQVVISNAPTVSLSGPGNPSCAGATLQVNSSAPPLAIQWMLNGAALVTQAPYASTGATVAGGNGGGSTSDRTYLPLGFFVDRQLNVFVAEANSNRVSKWAPGATAGVQVAGDAAVGAAPHQLYSPGGVYVDDYGNLYVADRGNYRVQKWAPDENTAVTVAGGNGSGSALNQLNYPVALTADDSGDLYIADYANARVVRWAPGADSGLVVAGGNGSGSALNQLNKPSFLFLDKSNGDLYIADEGNNRIVKWASGASTGVVVAGGNGAGSAGNQLNAPRGVWKDAAGNLFINDAGNQRIVFWPAGAGTGTVVAGGNGAGSASSQLNAPYGLQMDAAGNLYVADANNHRIQRFALQVPDTINAIAPGTYSATVIPASGCSATTNTYTISPLPLTTVDSAAPVICLGDTVSITASSTASKGNALEFDGSNGNYVSIPDAMGSSLAGLSHFTVGAWIYPRSASHQNILYKGQGCVQWHEWQLGIGGAEADYVFDSGKWTFSYFIVNAGSSYRIASANPAVLNQWSYVSVTYDGAKLRMYVNGVLENEQAAAGVPFDGSTPFFIGQDPGCGGRIPFDGRVDEVSLWSYTKSAADIAAMMYGLVPPASPGLLGYWPFDENNGRKVYDLGPGAHYGNLTGNTWTRQIPSTAPISAAASGSVSYTWAPATGLNTASGPSVTASPADTTQYTITTTHTASGCVNTARVTVDVNPLPSGTILPAGPVVACASALPTLQADSAAGYTWQWYFNGAVIPGATAGSYVPNASGNYSVLVTNATGCFKLSAPDSVSIVPDVTPSVTISALQGDTICAGTNVSFSGTAVHEGTAPQYQWLRNGAAVGGATPSYSDAALSNGDAIQLRLISNAVCRTTDTVFSNLITMTVHPTPSISGITFTDPTTCGGTDGSITIGGLTTGLSYTIYYSLGGTAQPPVIKTASAGAVTLGGLGAGSYSNISVTLGDCGSNVVAGPIVLTPPAAPVISGSSYTNPSLCGLSDGSITLTGLSDGVSYTINYSMGGVAQTPVVQTAALGSVTLSGLAAGSYSNISVTSLGCVSNTLTGTITLVPPTPVIDSVSFANPTTCGGTDGSITLWGLMPGVEYVVSYDSNGTAQPSVSPSADSSGAITLTGLAAGSYGNFSVTLATCSSAPYAGPVVLTPPASPSIGSVTAVSPTTCGGNDGALIVGGLDPNTSYSLSYFDGLSTVSISSATTNASGSYTIANLPAGTYSNITATLHNCNGSYPGAVTINPPPAPVISGSFATDPLTCGGNSGSITLTGLTAGTAYTVNYRRNGVAQLASLTADVSGNLVITGLTQGSYTFISATRSNCASNVVAGPIILSDPPIPPAPGAASNSPVCQGTSLTLTATGQSGASFSWTGPAGFSSNAQSPTVTTNMQSVNVGTYSVTQSVAGCVSSPATTVVAMSTVPAAPAAIAGNTAPCVGMTYQYSISPVSTAASYVWTIPAGAGWSGSSTADTLMLTAGAAAGTLYVAGVNVCGTGAAGSLSLTPNTVPAQPGAIIGPDTVCKNALFSYSVPSQTNTTSYTWSLPTGWTSNSTSLNIVSGTTGSTGGSISVTANNVCGASLAVTKSVVLITAPAQPGLISGNDSPCVNSMQVYSIAAVSGAASYAWSVPGGGSPAWSGASASTSFSATVGSVSGNLSVSAINQCGSSPARSLPIAVTQIPGQPGNITGKAAPCVGSWETYHLSAPASSALVYLWTIPGSWTGASTGDSITVNAGGSGGQISVAAMNLCGTGPSRTLSVSTIPVATTGVSLSRSTPTDTICAGTPVVFTATATGGGANPQYIFRKNDSLVSSGGSAYTDYNLANGDVVSVTMISSLPCVSQAQVKDSIRMYVIPQTVPGISINATPPVTICAGASETFTTTVVDGGSNPAFQWYKNGVALGVTMPAYTSNSLADGDTLMVAMHTSARCPVFDTAYSNRVGVSVKNIVNPTLSISMSPPPPYVPGTTVTFSIASSGGGNPTYQWIKNGVELWGETGASYQSSDLHDGDRISARMQSTLSCAMPSVVLSNVIIIESATGVTPLPGSTNWDGAVALYPNPNTGHFSIAVEWAPSHFGKVVHIEMLSVLGQKVFSTALRPDRASWSTEVWLDEGLANGNYLLRMSTEDGMSFLAQVTLKR